MKVEKNGNTYEIKTTDDIEYLIEWKSMTAQEILEAAGPEVVSIFADVVDKVFEERAHLLFRIDKLEGDLEAAKDLEKDLQQEIEDLEARIQEDKRDFGRQLEELEEQIDNLRIELEARSDG